MSRALNNYCRAGRIQAPVLVQCLASLANWCGVHAAIQFISVTSTEDREHMQVSASDHSETTILLPVSFSRKIRSMKSFSSAMLKAEKAWAWQTPQTLSWQDSWVADATVLRIPGILSLQSCWLFQFRAGMSNALNNFCRAGRTNTCVSSMSCESCSLANWCGVHAGSQFAFITSNEQRAHTQMGSNQNSFSQKVQWFVIPWQGHPFHQDSLTKEEWILEVSPGNAGPSSQASLCKYYTLVSFHQYEYVTVCGWIAGFKKLGPPKSHRLPADRV